MVGETVMKLQYISDVTRGLITEKELHVQLSYVNNEKTVVLIKCILRLFKICKWQEYL
jgi:hypothetical protein